MGRRCKLRLQLNAVLCRRHSVASETPEMVRHFMTFSAPGLQGTPDDALRELPPGRELAAALAEGVVRAGISLAEGVREHDSYGWYFVARTADGERIWCMLQASDDWLLITRPLVSLWRRILGGSNAAEAHGQVCEALDSAARQNAQISAIRWFTRKEFEAKAPGQDRP